MVGVVGVVGFVVVVVVVVVPTPLSASNPVDFMFAMSVFKVVAMLAIVVAIAMKIVGVLLITALLIIPAATARRFAAGPEQMALLAALFGVAAVVGGLFASLEWDTPSGPSIVVTALAIFVAGLIPVKIWTKRGESST